MGGLEQVQLHGGTEVSLVADEGAVAEIGLDIFQVMDVVDGGLGEVEGMDDVAQVAEGVELVARPRAFRVRPCREGRRTSFGRCTVGGR